MGFFLHGLIVAGLFILFLATLYLRRERGRLLQDLDTTRTHIQSLRSDREALQDVASELKDSA